MIVHLKFCQKVAAGSFHWANYRFIIFVGCLSCRNVNWSAACQKKRKRNLFLAIASACSGVMLLNTRTVHKVAICCSGIIKPHLVQCVFLWDRRGMFNACHCRISVSATLEKLSGKMLLQTAEVYIGKYVGNEVNKYYFLIG